MATDKSARASETLTLQDFMILPPIWKGPGSCASTMQPAAGPLISAAVGKAAHESNYSAMVTLEGRVFGRCSRSKRGILYKTTKGIDALKERKRLFTERMSNARAKMVAQK